MKTFENFPVNEANIRGKNGRQNPRFQEPGCNMVIYFSHADPYPVPHIVTFPSAYISKVKSGRIKLLGFNDVLGYEINGIPVYTSYYHKYVYNNRKT